MTAYAFIFARAGSKGLPNKNVKLLNNKPLIQYSIEQALANKTISKVFISTNDVQIIELTKNLDVEVIKRPEELATDNAPEWLAWQHAIQYVENLYGMFETFISLPATSPLRGDEDIEAAIKKLNETTSDICLSMTPASRSPYFNMVTESADGGIELVNSPEKTLVRRQDAPKVYDLTTVIYAANVNFIKRSNGLFEGKVSAIKVPKHRAIDIDDIYDFYLAEAVLRHNSEK